MIAINRPENSPALRGRGRQNTYAAQCLAGKWGGEEQGESRGLVGLHAYSSKPCLPD